VIRVDDRRRGLLVAETGRARAAAAVAHAGHEEEPQEVLDRLRPGPLPDLFVVGDRVERVDDKRLKITIISRFNGGPLLTSRIDVAFPSLRPIRTIEETDSKTDLSVRYRDGEARGTVTGGDGRRQTSEVPLPGPVWDEETIEFVLTTLPLAEGAHFELPVFHFGRGSGVARIDVRRSISAEGFGGSPIAAWEIEGSTRSDMTITFLVAKADRRLLAVEVGGVRSVLGGDCSRLTR